MVVRGITHCCIKPMVVRSITHCCIKPMVVRSITHCCIKPMVVRSITHCCIKPMVVRSITHCCIKPMVVRGITQGYTQANILVQYQSNLIIQVCNISELCYHGKHKKHTYTKRGVVIVNFD